MLAAVVATFAIAVTLLGTGLVGTWSLIVDALTGHLESEDAVMLHAVEIVDVFLVAMVVVVVSIGIYQLFVNHRIPVPDWLRIDDIDDLKAKLIGVVVTVLGVFFLGSAIAWDGSSDILALGIAVAAVALVLTYFLSVHFGHDGERDKHDPRR
jgi:uncharacterized membrane protein YqhA